MAEINVDLPFLLKNDSPVDKKQHFATLQEMKDFDERFLSATAIATCDETGLLYVYNSTNSVDANTGKWKTIGGGASDLEIMALTEYQDYMDGLIISATGYVDPTQP